MAVDSARDLAAICLVRIDSRFYLLSKLATPDVRRSRLLRIGFVKQHSFCETRASFWEKDEARCSDRFHARSSRGGASAPVSDSVDAKAKGARHQNNLRACRDAAGMSQRQIADTLGVSPKAVSSWETGRVEMGADHVLNLRAAAEPHAQRHPGVRWRARRHARARLRDSRDRGAVPADVRAPRPKRARGAAHHARGDHEGTPSQEGLASFSLANAFAGAGAPPVPARAPAPS